MTDDIRNDIKGLLLRIFELADDDLYKSFVPEYSEDPEAIEERLDPLIDIVDDWLVEEGFIEPAEEVDREEPLRLTGVCVSATGDDTKVYTREALENAVARFEQNRNSMIGELSPEGEKGMIRFANASHTIDNLSLTDDGKLIADITVLDVPQGRVLRQLLENHKEKVSFSPRFVANSFVTIDADFEVK